MKILPRGHWSATIAVVQKRNVGNEVLDRSPYHSTTFAAAQSRHLGVHPHPCERCSAGVGEDEYHAGRRCYV